jgi:rhodanese-related sulfurtransferase
LILTKRFFAEAGLIAGFSVILGLAFHVPVIRQFLAGEYARGFISGETGPGIILITLAEAEDLFAGGEGVFVDARSRKDFSVGHIPAAKNVPFEEAKGKAIVEDAAGIPRGKAVVIYCSGKDCPTGLALAVLLRDQGLEEVRVFMGGWDEWIAAGLPAERGNDQE